MSRRKKVSLEMYLRNNLGDDLFLWMISRRYPDVQFVSNVRKSYFRKLGIKNVLGKSVLQKVWEKILSRIKKYNKDTSRKCQAKVILGGSMFIEKGSIPEITKDLERYRSDMIPTYIIGANFGPFKSNSFIKQYREIFSMAKDVCFRDDYSASLFADLKNVRIAPDVVFDLDVRGYTIKQDKKVVISVINLDGRKDIEKKKDCYERKMAEIADYYIEKGYEVVLMSFCRYEGDEIAVARIKKGMKNPCRCHFYRNDIKKAIDEIASSELVIGTRFHSIVLGMLFNKRVLPITYSKKTVNTLKTIRYDGECLGINEFVDMSINEINDAVVVYECSDTIRETSEQQFSGLDRLIGNDGVNGRDSNED